MTHHHEKELCLCKNAGKEHRSKLEKSVKDLNERSISMKARYNSQVTNACL